MGVGSAAPNDELLLVAALAAKQPLHLARVQGLHLLGSEHLRILQVHEEILDLIGQESISLDAPFLLLLLLDLEATDFISDRLFKR